MVDPAGQLSLWLAYLAAIPLAASVAFLTYWEAASTDIAATWTNGVALLFVLALVHLQGYRRGLVIVLTFIATMQVLYYLNVPGVSDWVNARADSFLGAEQPAERHSP